MDEQALLDLLKTDVEAGIRQIIHVYGPAVHRICASILAGRPREELEEAESDVFVKLWKYRERVRLSETCSLRRYLFTIARNVSKNKLHGVRAETLSLEATLEDGIEPEASENTEETAAADWLRDTVAEAVAELDEPACSIFRKRYYDRCSVKEIAAHLNLPEKKVENILHRGRKRLRAILAEKGVTSYEEFGK